METLTPLEHTIQIAQKYGLTSEHILGRSRDKWIVKARREVCKELYAKGMSSKTIGNFLNRNHTSILYLLGKLSRNK